MQQYKQQFIEFALESDVLRFGEFTLKSGRTSPYFFNAGLFDSGASMLQLSRFFARSIRDADIQFDVLFGPAYKGITLSCATAMSLSEASGKPIPFAFNRKEKKDHGEGGNMVGAALQGKVAIIDDVITAGTAIRESFDIIKAHNATATSVFVAMDRQERGQVDGQLTDYSAIQQVEKEFGVPVIAIATMTDLIEFLKTKSDMSKHLDNMLAYREKYGIDS
jgi:orotate phosphoribosyltransferase